MDYNEIPGWFDFHRIYFEAVDRAPLDSVSTFAELGSFLGQSTAYMAGLIKTSDREIDFYAVDLWRVDPANDHNKLIEKHGQDIRGAFLDNMKACGVSEYVKDVQSLTTEAAAKFSAEGLQFDFIFVDANHTYKGVKADLVAWWPLLKEGGTMAGHDIYFKDVERAVTEFFFKDLGLKQKITFTPSCWIIKK